MNTPRQIWTAVANYLKSNLRPSKKETTAISLSTAEAEAKMDPPNPSRPAGPSAEQLAQYDSQLDVILARYTHLTTGAYQGHSFASRSNEISVTPVPGGQSLPHSTSSASDITPVCTTLGTQSTHHQLPLWPGSDYFWEAGSDYAKPPPGAPGTKVPLPSGYFLPSGHPALRVGPTKAELKVLHNARYAVAEAKIKYSQATRGKVCLEPILTISLSNKLRLDRRPS